jgi:hypothetical protein
LLGNIAMMVGCPSLDFDDVPPIFSQCQSCARFGAAWRLSNPYPVFNLACRARPKSRRPASAGFTKSSTRLRARL